MHKRTSTSTTPSPAPQFSFRALLTTVTVGALLVTVPALTPAFAEPNDSDSHAASSQTLAQLDVAIAQLETDQQNAYNEMMAAGEAYTAAIDEYQRASDFARDAASNAQIALTRANESKNFVVQLARESARGSQALDVLAAFFTSDGLEDIVTETEALAIVNKKTEQKLQEFQADKVVAEILQRAADESASDALAKRDIAQTALANAQALELQADTRAQEAQRQRADLVAQAATARNTSIAEEEARQEQLARDREERERQETLDRLEREEAERENNNVVVEEEPRPSQTEQPAQPEPTATPTPTSSPTASPTATPTPTATPSPSATPAATPSPSATPTPTPTPSPTATPTPTPTATPTPTPTPTKTPDPEPEKPTNDPYGLGTGTSRGSASKGLAAIEEAKLHLGKPYIWGGTGPTGYDCSGLTMTAWKAAGVNLNRTSRDQYKQVLKIKLSNMRPGDLIFWGDGAATNNPSKITHVAMYIGGGQMIEASRPGVPLRITSVRYDSRIMPYAGRV